ncbi:spore germination protein, amino acid permease [Desulfosporosinus acidiphilus SJ4]|uniref:Spore germination protein, amino acid permease n=1 Tax=Desulfosporosinus acidiphilus (strain DSM 22704 / JCM 16185 / SJ4) TaxID=646529 RepID=I4D7L5_DESAJ|nr:endospore germination permease [Desulfosporosinus acidiphilus]AFM41789.1 spore germination protein, amino acid permease [Desulfosporosinus acidiphilus SJ4]
MNKRAAPIRNISDTQLAMLMFISIISTVTLFVPAIAAQGAHQDSWLASGVIPSLTGIFNVVLATKLAQWYPDQTIIQYCELIFGKIVGKLLAFSYVCYFLITNIVIIRELVEFLTVMLLPGTPIIFLSGVFVIASCYVVPKGPEVICRMSQFLLPLFITFFIILISLTIPDWNYTRLTPVFEGGIIPIIRGSIVPSAWFGEMILLTMFMPNVNKPQEMLKKGILMVIILSLMVTLDTFATLAVFGPDLTAVLTFPVMSLIKYIKIGSLFQRLETYMIGYWIGTMFLKIIVFFYAVHEGLAQNLNINNSRWILCLLAIVQILGATFLFSNTLDINEFLTLIWVKMAFAFEGGLLLFIWFAAFIRIKWSKQVRRTK